MLTIPELVDLLGVSPGRVHRLIEDHALLAVRVDGAPRVPEEFVDGEQPVTNLRGTAMLLLDAGFSEDEAARWLLSDNDELRARPIDELRAGRKSAVRRAAQALAF